MTVVLITNTLDFIGLSTDTKPTDSPAGSTFYETDTGVTFIWNGSAWSVGG